MFRLVVIVVVLFCSATFAEENFSKLWDEYSKPKITKPRPAPPKPVVDGEWPIYHARHPWAILVPARRREFVLPEDVGVEKDCPFPTVKDPIFFQCPKCGAKQKMHILPKYLPYCGKDLWVMNEVEK